MSNNSLWYSSPAKQFIEALPIGNGSFGAMIYGSTPSEKLSLNYDTFWSGTLEEKPEEVDKKILSEIKELSLNGDSVRAEKLIQDHLLGHYNESYMPFGNFSYEISPVIHPNHYRRELDLEKGIAHTTYSDDTSSVECSVFASYPDHCIAGRIRIKSGISHSVRLSLYGELKESIATGLPNGLDMIMQAPSHVVPNYVTSDNPVVFDHHRPGMKGVCSLFTRSRNDKGIYTDDSLLFKNVEEIEFFLTADDGYSGFGKELNCDTDTLVRENHIQLERIGGCSYEEILDRHLLDYQSLYNRVYLHLNGSDNDLATDRRLEEFKNGSSDDGIYVLYFNFARYLMIASSRPGSQPSNLQGIWSESIRPVWSSNWTININTQMNYWMAEPGNLSECAEPLVKFVQEISKSGELTARNLFGCRGWTANHNVDLWRQTSPVGGDPQYAFWPMGGIWLTNQIYANYRYTRDKQLLENTIFPIMRGAAMFLIDWMTQGRDGRYYTAAASSPENRFLDEEGHPCCISPSPAIDTALADELFRNYMEACSEMEIEDDLCDAVQKHLQNLPDFKVNREGCLQEWNRDYREVDPGHRHFSPVLGFYPGWIINETDTPELIQAVRNRIEKRIVSGSGNTGWSCAWAVSLYAKLHNADRAAELLRRLICKYTYMNLFDVHPKIDINGEIFQIDGNFGGAVGIINMIMFSNHGVIMLLPALPKDWIEGKVRGLRAENRITVSVEWRENRLYKAVLISDEDGEIHLQNSTEGRYRVSCDDTPVDVHLNNKNIAMFSAKKGQDYVIELQDL